MKKSTLIIITLLLIAIIATSGAVIACVVAQKNLGVSLNVIKQGSASTSIGLYADANCKTPISTLSLPDVVILANPNTQDPYYSEKDFYIRNEGNSPIYLYYTGHWLHSQRPNEPIYSNLEVFPGVGTLINGTTLQANQVGHYTYRVGVYYFADAGLHSWTLTIIGSDQPI